MPVGSAAPAPSGNAGSDAAITSADAKDTKTGSNAPPAPAMGGKPSSKQFREGIAIARFTCSHVI